MLNAVRKIISSGVALAVLACALCVGGFAARANADSLVITEMNKTTGAGGFTTYSYTLGLQQYSALYMPLSADDAWAPDFIEIFDFAGLHTNLTFTANTACGLTDSDFKVSALKSDPPVEALADFGTAGAADDSFFYNLKAEFNRATALVNYTKHTLILGTLTAVSAYSNTTADTYISTDTDTKGKSSFYVGGIDVPLGPAAAAPLPSVFWAGAGLFGFAALSQSRRRRLQTA